MRRNFRLIGLGLSLLLSALANPAFAKDTAQIPNPPNNNTFGVVVSDQDFFGGNSGSLLYATDINNMDQAGQTVYQKICTSTKEAKCDPSKLTLGATATLGPCKGEYLNPCIDSVEVFDETGKLYKFKYKRSVIAPEFVGDPSLNLPDGKTISIWSSEDVPGIKNISVQYLMNMGAKLPTDREFIPQSISVLISPFIERSHALAKSIYFVEVPPDDPLYKFTGGNIRSIGGSNYEVNCAWQENGICGVEQEFEDGYTYQLTIAIPKAFSGWLQGRLVNPEILITNVSEKFNLMRISAKAADVPRVITDVDYSKKNPTFDEIFRGSKAYAANSGIRIGLSSDQLSSTRALDAFADQLQNKANVKTTKWYFKSNAQGNSKSLNKCLYSDSKLMGMVTTNALIYESGIPSFSKGFLEYKVAGLHLNPDGTVFQGAYDLLLRSEAARCLYGFSSAPVSAEISVTSSEGDKKVATTRVSEENGWLHLGAYNFTFSEPTIKMEIKQDSVVFTQNPSPNISPIPSPLVSSIIKQSTITCIKNKLIKKVTAVKPICPSGYKKK